MAFSKKPSLVVMLVVLMLLVTQPVLSKRLPGAPRPPRPSCKIGCYLKCLFKTNALWCIGKCIFGFCQSKKKSSSDPSVHCGIGCIRSRCYNPGSGKVSVKCASSCVNGCEATFVGELY